MKTLSPDKFVDTIYLGDRACKAVIVNCWEKEVSIGVDLISRIRDPSGAWKYYSKEDVEDGRLLFTGVQKIFLEPPGCIPNDYINYFSAKAYPCEPEKSLWEFTLSIDSVADDGSGTEVLIRIIAVDVFIEDPSRNGLRIRD